MQTCRECDEDEAVRVLIITGNDKAFAGTSSFPDVDLNKYNAAGADIKEMATASVMKMARPDNFITQLAEVSKVRKPGRLSWALHTNL